LPAHGSRLGVGVRHAVQVDQADSVALRRHAAGAGHLVARPHQGRWWHPPPVPPRDRHRPDDSRGDGYQGAGGGRRHPAKAHRRREYGVHVRCGERRRTVHPPYPVLRDGRQPWDLQRWLVCEHNPPGAAVGAEREDAGRQRLQVGAVQPHRGLLAGERSRGEDARQAQGDAGPLRAGGEQVPGGSAGQPGVPARDLAAAECDGGTDRLHLRRREPRHPDGNAPSILNKSFTITAEIEVPKEGTEGMIVTDGGRFGGYALYLLRGKPVFVYNLLDLERYRWEGGVGGHDWLGRSLTRGKHTIVFDFTYDGPGPGKGGTGVLKVDDRDLATRKIEHTIPFILPPSEDFDVGLDTRTPV